MRLFKSFRFCPYCGQSWQQAGSLSTAANRIRCLKCSRELYQDPKIAACAIVQTAGGIVMIKRRYATPDGIWAIPGGFVDVGETVEAAAIREFLEETGLHVTIDRLIGVYSYEDNPVILIVFSGLTSEAMPKCGPEAVEVAFFHEADIPWGQLAFPANREALQDYLKINGRA